MDHTFLIISDQVKANCLVAVAGLELDKWEVVIKPKTKTPPQRRYWHKCISVLCEGTGYSLIELKTIIKRQVFGTKSFTDRKGIVYERDISSEELSIKDYGKLIDHTHVLAGMAGIKLPLPELYGFER
jgi:hypothetical protein